MRFVNHLRLLLRYIDTDFFQHIYRTWVYTGCQESCTVGVPGKFFPSSRARPSAIWLRQEFPVQRNITLFGEYLLKLSLLIGIAISIQPLTLNRWVVNTRKVLFGLRVQKLIDATSRIDLAMVVDDNGLGTYLTYDLQSFVRSHNEGHLGKRIDDASLSPTSVAEMTPFEGFPVRGSIMWW